MNYKRGLGIGLIFVGILIILTAQTITGAVIGARPENFLGLLGVISLIGGILLVFLARHGRDDESDLERRTRMDVGLTAEAGIVLPDEAAERLDNIVPGKKKSLVLDTSYIRSYTEKGTKALLEDLKEYDEVIVPDSVFKELGANRFRELRNVINSYKNKKKPHTGFEKYKDAAGKYLEQGSKNIFYEKIIPILLGEKEPPKTRREAIPLKKKAAKLLGYLKEDKLPLTKENLIKTLERHYKISETDKDVLAAAVAQARYNRKDVVVAERDIDFEDAIELIKEDPRRIIKEYSKKIKKGEQRRLYSHPKKLGKLLHYSNPYEEAA